MIWSKYKGHLFLSHSLNHVLYPLNGHPSHQASGKGTKQGKKWVLCPVLLQESQPLFKASKVYSPMKYFLVLTLCLRTEHLRQSWSIHRKGAYCLMKGSSWGISSWFLVMQVSSGANHPPTACLLQQNTIILLCWGRSSLYLLFCVAVGAALFHVKMVLILDENHIYGHLTQKVWSLYL